ncbi:MAG: trimethylamine methyltransferase family protein, partial [Eubacterium sp.]
QEVHSASRDDFIKFSKLNHQNDRIHLACPYILEPFDIPLEYREDYRMSMSLKYSDKPTFSITRDGNSAKESIEFTQHFWDNPNDYLLMGIINISAPLIMGEGTADVLIVLG